MAHSLSGIIVKSVTAPCTASVARTFGKSCGRRSRSQLTPLPAVHVFPQCPLRPYTATMLESGQLCEGQIGGNTYSTIGLVASHTTCRPWATAAAGSADDEVAEGSVGVCLYVSACETKAACETYLRLALLRTEVKKSSHRLVSIQTEKREV